MSMHISHTSEIHYPEVAAAVRAITRARLEDKQFAERKPTTLLKVHIDDCVLEIAPVINSSPTGWKVTGGARLKLITPDGRGIVAALWINGRVQLLRWWRDAARTEREASILRRALSMIADDPTTAITRRHHHCGVCGRALTDEVSMRRGIGPECWRIWDRVVAEITMPDSDYQQAKDSAIAQARREMQRWHPDRDGGDAEKFMLARAAYERARAQA